MYSGRAGFVNEAAASTHVAHLKPKLTWVYFDQLATSISPPKVPSRYPWSTVIRYSAPLDLISYLGPRLFPNSPIPITYYQVPTTSASTSVSFLPIAAIITIRVYRSQLKNQPMSPIILGILPC